MRPEVIIRQRLLESPDVATRVGVRIFPMVRPATGPLAALPAIVFQRVAPGVRYSAHGEPADLGAPRIQIMALSGDIDEAWEVSNAARQALDGWSDRTAIPRIDGVSCDDAIEQYEDDTKIHVVLFDAIVRYGT